MLKYFAGRRFNMIDLMYNAAATSFIWQEMWWWAGGVFVCGIALSGFLEWKNGQYS